MTFSANRAAAALLEARRTRQPIAVAPDGPADAAQAFAVQDVVARALGPAAAWKVGTAGPGKPHTRAPIAVPLVRPSPCRWPAGEFLRIGIEVEIAFRIGRHLASPSPDPQEVRAAIDAIHAVIEIVDSRFDTWPVPDPLWALADNQNNGGLVYAPQGRTWEGGDLSSADVQLTVDGASAFSGRGTNPAGDPFGLLVWLAGHLADRGGLPAGTLVTTGSLTGILFVESGASVVADIDGIGRVEATFPAAT